MRLGLDYVELRPELPTALEITLAEEAMGWLGWIKSPEVRRMVWDRACGVSGRKMAKAYKHDRKTLERICRDGLERIAGHLNAREA
ncbi:MAG: hypothetical protein HQL97_15655 [Magnetococcales bacterium]|nr:hypothetical protein [Magnetococcales bacterium]